MNAKTSCFKHIGARDHKNLNKLVFANDPGDLGSIPGRVIPKTLKNGS